MFRQFSSLPQLLFSVGPSLFSSVHVCKFCVVLGYVNSWSPLWSPLCLLTTSCQPGICGESVKYFLTALYPILRCCSSGLSAHSIAFPNQEPLSLIKIIGLSCLLVTKITNHYWQQYWVRVFHILFQIDSLTFVPSQLTLSVKLLVLCSLPCHIRTIVLTKLVGGIGATPRKHATDFCSSNLKCSSFSWVSSSLFVEKHRSISRVLKWLLLIILCNFYSCFFSRGFGILLNPSYWKFQLLGGGHCLHGICLY